MVRQAFLLLVGGWIMAGLPSCALEERHATDDTAELQTAEVTLPAPDDLTTAERHQRIPVSPPRNWNPNPDRTPQYIHMTWQHDPATTITIQWQTAEEAASTYTPKVWLSRASDIQGADPARPDAQVAMVWESDLTATGKAVRYCLEASCADEASMTGRQWEVEVTGLEPDTDYYYRVGTWTSFDRTTRDFEGADLSPVYHLRTGLPKGSTQRFVFGFGSDTQNWLDDFNQQVARICDTTGKEASFWLHGGDQTEVGTQEQLWQWFDVLAPLLQSRVLMPVRGNHGIGVDTFRGQFALPVVPELDESYRELAWSFNYGNAHIVGLDVVTEAQVDKALAFLESDLAAADADPEIDWKVAVFHFPMYSSASVHGSTGYLVRKVEPLFDTYGVDLALSGHDHDYERTFPLDAGQVTAEGHGTVYVVSGGFYSKKFYTNGTSDFTAFSASGEVRSYVILSVEGNTLKGTAYKGNHELLDSFELTK